MNQLWGGGVKLKIYETKKKVQNQLCCWQHMRANNNKTNKAQASRFCSRIPSLKRTY